jgi:hypothetical protein
MRSWNRIVGNRAQTIAAASALAALALAPPGAAQQCTEASVAEQRGTWFESRPSLTHANDSAPPSLHPKILKRIEPIAAMFREAYPEPRGTEANGQAMIARFGNEIPGGPLQYGYESMHKTWLCPKSTRRAVIAGETGNWAQVYVNSLHHLLSEVGELQIEGRPAKVWMLARRIGDLRGETLYETRYGRALVFTRKGSYPWKPVSQKQYLDALVLHYEKEAGAANSAMDEWQRAMEKNIAEVKQTLTGETRDKVVAEMERGLAQARAQRPKSRDKMARAVAGDLQYIRDYQARHSEQEMAQPAVLPKGGGLASFRGKFWKESDREVDSVGMLLVVDPSYFRKDLPPEAAQLVTLLWQWEKEGLASEAWRATFERRFPIDRLRSMIDR